MRAFLFFAVAAVLCSASESRADKIGPPESYKVVSPNGKYVFVMLAPDTVPGDANNPLRATYKRSGLYKNDGSADPLWTVDWYSRAVVLPSDGVHVVRVPGPHTYTERLNADRTKRVLTAADLKKEALSIFAKGKLVREFTIGDFADDPQMLRKTVTFFRWQKQIKFIEGDKQLEVVTLDGNRAVIDVATGKIVEKKKAE
jgi:hypothetical protein